MGWVDSVTRRQRFTLVKRPPVPTGREAGRASELVWTKRLEEKYFVSAGDRTPTVQYVVRHCTDLTTTAHIAHSEIYILVHVNKCYD
jgi:hypothetical protein